MKGSRINFIDIAVSMNVHVFIIWEFIRRFGYEKEVKKDKYGRGTVSARACRRWITGLYIYVKQQDFTYKQDINKRQYLFRDENRLLEEKKNEQDVSRMYMIDKKGRIARRTTYADGTFQMWVWNTDGGGWLLDNV